MVLQNGVLLLNVDEGNRNALHYCQVLLERYLLRVKEELQDKGAVVSDEPSVSKDQETSDWLEATYMQILGWLENAS